MTSPAQPAPDVPETRTTVLGTIRAVLRSRWAWIVAALLVTAMSISAFAFDGFRMKGPDMAPTLTFGDRLVVYKRAYGWLEHRTPARGDVVVFRSPERAGESTSRVIGLSGDTIALQQGIVYINGWRVPSCLAGLANVDVDGKEHAGVVLVELLGDTAYLVFHDDAGRGHEHTHGDDRQAHGHADESEGAPSNAAKGHGHGLGMGGPYTVPHNEVFVLGDNRENSEDSRAWFDAHGKGLGIDQINGRATFVWSSFDAAGRAKTSRVGISVTGAPKCPKGFSPETCAGLEKCLANRPPREATTPPAPKPITPSP